MNLFNKTITILGAQRSGQAVARLIAARGGKVKVSEKGESTSEDFLQWMKQNDVAFESKGHAKTFIEESDLLVVSPGVPITAEPIKWARNKGIDVIGEMELASHFCNKTIIAVTGSNGKTTTTTLIHQVLESAGYKSCLCGNIGKPLAECIKEIEDVDFVVLEVSSFQLETIKNFHPFIAVFLNFSQNHLDRHKDMDEYFSIKKRMFVNQTQKDFAVLNKEDKRVYPLASEVSSKVVCFEASNQEAVRKVANILNIKKSICDHVFKDFKGIEHRLEWVRNIKGVDFINDSKATTVEAGRWALNHVQQPVVLICGGKDKNSDFSVLKEDVQKFVKKMFIIGDARLKIKKVFERVVEIQECEQLEEAVVKALEFSDSGDTILLSPMCASFDMFLNYEERGKKFKEIVNNLM